MFNLEHHQKIHSILSRLNSDFLVKIGAYFGGGTQLALQYDEYRWSKDIDFICPIGPGYRELRRTINAQQHDGLFNSIDDLTFPREVKADQYGVRFAVIFDNTPIKFEIIAEGRIELGDPAYYDWCSVPCLNFNDACSEKLLSNADRWADESVRSRDLIDLSVLRLQSPFSDASYRKANNAYDVIEPLVKALTKFQTHPNYREKCFTSLQVVNQHTIINGMDLLATDQGLSVTKRTQEEKNAEL